MNIFGGSRSSAWDRRKKKEKKGGWGKRQHKRLRKMCAHTRMHTHGPAHGHIQRHLVLPSGFSQTQCRLLHQQSSTDFSRLASLCVTMVELAQQHGRTRLPSRQLWPWRPSLLFFARLKPSCVEKTLVGNSRFLLSLPLFLVCICAFRWATVLLLWVSVNSLLALYNANISLRAATYRFAL